MRSFLSNKLWVALLSLLALGALTTLAFGLESMTFRERQIFTQNKTEETSQFNPTELINAVTSIPLSTLILVWSLIIALFVLLALALSPEARKRLLLFLFRLTITCWVIYMLFTRYPQALAQIGLNLTSFNSGAQPIVNSVAPPAFTPPPPASWIAYLVSFIIAVTLGLFTWKTYSIWKEFHTPVSPNQKFAQIARSSLRDLSSGRDSTDVIVNCYYRMSDAISEKKNLQRSESMTPNEFAQRLEQTGLPGDAVKRLTRLFESARYGGHRSDSKTINEAVACLTTILQHCEEGV